jgi:hypothetical protein
MSIASAFNSDGGTGSSGGSAAEQGSQDFSSQLNGSKTTFTISESFQAGSLKIYYNGLRQSSAEITETGSGFTISFAAPANGESLIADYLKT